MKKTTKFQLVSGDRAGVPGRLARRVRAYNIGFVSLFGLLAAGGLAGCSNSSSIAPPVAAASSNVSLPYRIGPGDTLSVFVYGSPDLSVHGIPVRPDGRIAIPLVPSIVAVGKTPRELGVDITHKLSKFVRDPNVTVIVDSFHGMLGSAIRVIGGGAKPVAVPYVDHITLLDVMTEIGGLPQFAAANDAYIIRHTATGDEKIPVKLGALINRGAMSQDIQMMPGDILVIPQTMF
ncbi:XrtA/PEP-CTERM system exopolysaccharide export protein [Acidiphilium acidophilum]|uniref:Polysaccharide biosynthesis/export family protein n=1 Tax=Acidiphilium acidophilum TaxID=76588 RepID=A0AAW9DMY3_ACIAO|nr:XrtA/PEP-CTERM system exopolysaccharide export protein [Acidiphilium acidophilum]MDX5930090.1 polysaccharide biosynthesis/export family protein [Acidiphilium acidophilum]GBR75252.1 polysaccharide export protein [Acidiphilium acidophilum DSM 700]